jgi:hypothetical protein
MREMLSAAQQVGPSAIERAALAGKLGVATSGLWILPALKGLAATALVAGGVWIATAGPPTEKAVKRTPPAATQQAPLVARAAPPVELAQPALKAPASESSADAAPDGTPAVKPRPSGRSGAPEVAQPSETSLIAGARSSLDAAPSTALGLLSKHAQIYPQGVLSEEREVLRIRALKNLGREKDARVEEEKFHKAHPESVHHVP